MDLSSKFTHHLQLLQLQLQMLVAACTTQRQLHHLDGPKALPLHSNLLCTISLLCFLLCTCCCSLSVLQVLSSLATWHVLVCP